MNALSWIAVALLGAALPMGAGLRWPRAAQAAFFVVGMGFGVAGIVA